MSVIGLQSLGRLQRYAESRMRDTCVVTRPSLGGGELDPTTWLPVTSAASTVYSGPCRVRMPGTVSASKNRDVAGDVVAITEPVLSVPVSAPRLDIGDVVLITATPSDDPAGHLRSGMRYRVIGLGVGTDVTAQRLTVQAVTG